MREVDTRFMKEALRLAKKGLGRTSPNPVVGAVIVRNGEIIGKGYHRRAGAPHAEIEALNELGGVARDCTLYVTLEPCNHHGKTPPCTDAILKSGLKRVVVGMKDPNPHVLGNGSRRLQAHGIEVKMGVLGEACSRLNEAFTKLVTSGRPFVMVKSALTMDGWTATATGQSKWITNSKSRRFVHRLRDRVDAVMVGVGTVLADDPSLTTRLLSGKGRDPMRIVVDTQLKIPLNAKVLNEDSPSRTLIAVGSHVAEKALDRVRKKGVSIVPCPLKSSRIDLNAFVDILGKMGVSSLLVEGGARLVGSLLRERLVDKFYIFKASKLFGGDDGVPMARGPGPKRMDQCIPLKDIEIRRFEQDILVVAYPAHR